MAERSREENASRSKIVKALKSLDARSVENRQIGAGTPDINYIGGWIELKYLASWPKGAETLVRVPHYTPQQRAWARVRVHRGGTVWMLLQIRDEWLLIEGSVAAHTLGYVDKAQLLSVAVAYWPRGLNMRELEKWLRQRSENPSSPPT